MRLTSTCFAVSAVASGTLLLRRPSAHIQRICRSTPSNGDKSPLDFNEDLIARLRAAEEEVGGFSGFVRVLYCLVIV